MALSGTFSNKWKGYTYQVSWSATQNTSGNYSTITCTHKLICDSTWALYIDGRTITCTINSVNKTVSTSSISTGGGTTITLGTTTHTVNHSSNGAGSFSLSSTFPIQATIQGTYQSSISVSGSATLNTIPRASSMTFPEFTMGTAGTINISKASTDFTHTITYSFGSKSGTIANKTSGTSVSWTPSINELASQLPNSTRGYGTLTLITYSGTTEVGRNSYVFYCNVPNSIAPTVGTITLTPTAINGNNILVQGKNKLTISVTGSSAGTGSSIKSYTFDGPGISTTTTNSSVSISSVSTSGTLTYTIKVTDSRGRVTSKTATIACYGYAAPSFSSFEINRDSSNNIKCTYNVSYSTVNSTNKITVKFSYKKASGSWTDVTTTLSDSSKTNYTVLSNASDEVYNVRATVTDSYGASVTSSTQTVFGSARIMNIPQGGNGVSFGRKSTVASKDAAGKFEVGWDATFDKSITASGNINTSGDITASGNINGVDISKNTYMNGGGKTVDSHEWVVNSPSFIGTYTMNDVWYNVISVRHRNGQGDGTNYGMELRSKLTNDDSLSWRQQSGGTWRDWKTLLDTGNTADYVVEQGTSGVWTYRKWNSGLAECWGTHTMKTASTGVWGSMFYSNKLAPRINYPFTFKSRPQENVFFRGGSVAGWIYPEAGGIGVNTTTQTGSYGFVRPTSMEEAEVTYEYTVVGRWK